MSPILRAGAFILDRASFIACLIGCIYAFWISNNVEMSIWFGVMANLFKPERNKE